MKTWKCPNCYKLCEFGKQGCEDPEECPEEKNINHLLRRKPTEVKGVGISEIANKEV